MPGFGQAFFVFQIKSKPYGIPLGYYFIDLTNIWYYAVCEFAPDIFVGRKI